MRCQNALSGRLDLLVATPPCQGMSSSNPSRGRRQSAEGNKNDVRNRLVLELIPLARKLKPRVIVAENVRPIITLRAAYRKRSDTIINLLKAGLPNYVVFHGVVDMAEYGVPQTRKRAIIVAVKKSEPWLRTMKGVPWPDATHSQEPLGGLQRAISVKEWFEAVGYEPLDSGSRETSTGTTRMHSVPTYGGDYYLRVRDIPPYSGRNSFENDTCPDCQLDGVAEGLALCPNCGSLMRNRPYVEGKNGIRLVKGFDSSYRRMHPDKPASTIMTNSSHVGGDFKIHPWENRVLSTLECADLQTAPRFFDWSRAYDERRAYRIRAAVGEALPPYFTYLHGQLLVQFLSNAYPKQLGAQV